MISIFVQSYDKKGEALVADHYEMVAVPMIGDQIVIEDGSKQHMLRVTSVIHSHKPKGETMTPRSYIEVLCELIDTLDTNA